MLFAKYAETAARFQKNLDRILLKKFYMAVVRGIFPEETVDCQMPLREDPNDHLRLRMHHFDDGTVSYGFPQGRGRGSLCRELFRG